MDARIKLAAGVFALAALVSAGSVRAQSSDLEALLDAREAAQQAESEAAGQGYECDPEFGACESDIDAIVVTGMSASAVASASAAISITNNQEIGVDEGDIVKLKGDILIVLRRGRLFTISIAGGAMRPVAAVNAYAPNLDGDLDWYDEMLVSDTHVLVIGYSYGRGGTEINRFRLSSDGALAYEDSYHLRSDDYYSSRNYASRLIGDELIFYSPLPVYRGESADEILPAVRPWTGDPDATFQPVATASDILIPPSIKADPLRANTLHSVTRCDTSRTPMPCHATGVLAERSRSFYVSGEAVYIWVSPDTWRGYWAEIYGDDDDKAAVEDPLSTLYRIPLDGGRPGGVQARGAPVDQFSFNEYAEDGLVDVLVFSDTHGDAMWRAEFAEGAPALLTVPLNRFSDNPRVMQTDAYRMLPALPEHVDEVRNRFVGEHLLYGAGVWFDEDSDEEYGVITAVPLDGRPARTFRLQEPLDRIEVVGRDALAVGSSQDTVFTTIELGRLKAPRLGDKLRLPDAEEADARSHAFFYRADDASGDDGVLGLPLARSGDHVIPDMFYSADIVFLGREDRKLSEIGSLDSAPGTARDDGCVASCVDWYGNARPIFIRDRVFGLMGYELVEGRVENGRIREVGRVDFQPPGRADEQDD